MWFYAKSIHFDIANEALDLLPADSVIIQFLLDVYADAWMANYVVASGLEAASKMPKVFLMRVMVKLRELGSMDEAEEEDENRCYDEQAPGCRSVRQSWSTDRAARGMLSLGEL